MPINKAQHLMDEMTMASTKVLVVDDNADAADLTVEILRMHGVDAMAAHGGAEAIAAAREFAPSVIFLDLGMPEVDGYEVAKTLRADHTFDSVKIVALTAWGDIDSRDRTEKAGFNSHLLKPANFSTLLEFTQ